MRHPIRTLLACLGALAAFAAAAPALAAHAWVSLGGPGGSITRYAPGSTTPAASFAVPAGASDLILSADGSQLIVGTTSNAQANIPAGAPSVVALLDAASGAELARYPMPASVVKLVREGSGRRVYATGTAADGTVVTMSLDLQTGATASAPVPGATAFGLYALGISADGATLFVATRDQLLFIDSSSLAVTATLSMPSNGVSAPPLATPDGRTLMLNSSTRVYAVDLATRTLRAQRDIANTAAAFGNALSPDGRTYYVNGGTIAALDTGTLTLLRSASLGQDNPRRLGLSPDGSTIYATDLTYATTLVLDAATLATQRTLRHIAPPWAVAVRADGSPLFLDENANALVQVDTETLAAGARFPVGSTPGAAVSSLGKLFVPETANVALQRTPSAPQPAVPLPVEMISVSSAAAIGDRVYANSGSQVRVIDARREKVLARPLLLRVPQSGGIGSALQIAPAGDGSTLLASYVALNFSTAPVGGGLLRVNPATGRQQVLSSFPFLPLAVAADRSGQYAYATGFLVPGALGQWDLANGRFVRAVAPAGNPQYGALATSADGSLLLAADAHGKVDLLDTASMSVVAQLPAGTRPSGVAVSADGTRALVTDAGAPRVTVIDLPQRRVLGTVEVGAPSQAVSFVD